MVSAISIGGSETTSWFIIAVKTAVKMLRSSQSQYVALMCGDRITLYIVCVPNVRIPNAPAVDEIMANATLECRPSIFAQTNRAEQLAVQPAHTNVE